MSYYRKASGRAALSARARNHHPAWLEGVNRLPLAALVVYGFAAVAIMIASSMGGFVGADLLSRMVAGDPKLKSQRTLLDGTVG